MFLIQKDVAEAAENAKNVELRKANSGQQINES
jgi:hypothetical protein